MSQKLQTIFHQLQTAQRAKGLKSLDAMLEKLTPGSPNFAIARCLRAFGTFSEDPSAARSDLDAAAASPSFSTDDDALNLYRNVSYQLGLIAPPVNYAANVKHSSSAPPSPELVAALFVGHRYAELSELLASPMSPAAPHIGKAASVAVAAFDATTPGELLRYGIALRVALTAAEAAGHSLPPDAVLACLDLLVQSGPKGRALARKAMGGDDLSALISEQQGWYGLIAHRLDLGTAARALAATLPAAESQTVFATIFGDPAISPIDTHAESCFIGLSAAVAAGLDRLVALQTLSERAAQESNLGFSRAAALLRLRLALLPPVLPDPAEAALGSLGAVYAALSPTTPVTDLSTILPQLVDALGPRLICAMYTAEAPLPHRAAFAALVFSHHPEVVVPATLRPSADLAGQLARLAEVEEHPTTAAPLWHVACAVAARVPDFDLETFVATALDHCRLPADAPSCESGPYAAAAAPLLTLAVRHSLVRPQDVFASLDIADSQLASYATSELLPALLRRGAVPGALDLCDLCLQHYVAHFAASARFAAAALLKHGNLSMVRQFAFADARYAHSTNTLFPHVVCALLAWTDRLSATLPSLPKASRQQRLDACRLLTHYRFEGSELAPTVQTVDEGVNATAELTPLPEPTEPVSFLQSIPLFAASSSAACISGPTSVSIAPGQRANLAPPEPHLADAILFFHALLNGQPLPPIPDTAADATYVVAPLIRHVIEPSEALIETLCPTAVTPAAAVLTSGAAGRLAISCAETIFASSSASSAPAFHSHKPTAPRGKARTSRGKTANRNPAAGTTSARTTPAASLIGRAYSAINLLAAATSGEAAEHCRSMAANILQLHKIVV
jgi:hypothetical protein